MSVNKLLKGVDILPCPRCWKLVLRYYTNDDGTKIWISCFKCGHDGPKASSLRGAMKNWRDHTILAKKNILKQEEDLRDLCE